MDIFQEKFNNNSTFQDIHAEKFCYLSFFALSKVFKENQKLFLTQQKKVFLLSRESGNL